MSISIRNTTHEEIDTLIKIQKAAFYPLYEQFHDEGNPYLRGSEDILWRMNKNNRYFTILYDDKIVGGIFYRLNGKLSPSDQLGVGEYYLARIYIHPYYQNKGIAKRAILLCEKEFPDAELYYVDFPKVLEKNRKCYESVGYVDTGTELSWRENVPTLSMFKKVVNDPFMHAEVTIPIVYEVEKNELSECLDVIHKSFSTVAEEFGLTLENCAKHASFIPLSLLENQMDCGWLMYALYAGKKIIGYMSLSIENDIFELHNLSVLPEYRHKGFGRLLLDYAKNTVKALGGNTINIGIIEENTILKNWYIENGFVQIGTIKYGHLPFTSENLIWKGEK